MNLWSKTAPCYQYSFRLLEVVTGDTLKIEIDIGFEIRIVKKVRLLGIIAPSLTDNDAEGVKSRDWLKSIIEKSEYRIIESHWVARGECYMIKLFCDGCFVNDLSVEFNYSRRYEIGDTLRIV